MSIDENAFVTIIGKDTWLKDHDIFQWRSIIEAYEAAKSDIDIPISSHQPAECSMLFNRTAFGKALEQTSEYRVANRQWSITGLRLFLLAYWANLPKRESGDGV